jgi:hypothetical protein
MKLKRRYILALSLASIGAISAFASVSAASISAGTPSATRDQVKSAMKQAFTSGDYQAYLATTKDYNINVPVLTEVQFNAMVEANKLRAKGDVVGAKALLDKAGIKPRVHQVRKGMTKGTKTISSVSSNKGIHKDMGIKKWTASKTTVQAPAVVTAQ